MAASLLRRRTSASLAALLTFSAVYVFAATARFELSGGGLVSRWDSETGRLVELSCDPAVRNAEPWTFIDQKSGAGGFEVFDEMDMVRYSDRSTPCRISGLKITQVGILQKAEFTKQFEGAPFEIRVSLTADAEGLHLETSTVLIRQEDQRWPDQRNVRLSFVIPAGEGLTGWAPSYPDPAPVREKPVRYCYGIQEPGLPRTGVPLYTLYRPGKAGLSICVPLDLPKVQLNLGPEPEDPSGLYVDVELDQPNAGAGLRYLTDPAKLEPQDIRVIRLTELFVGLTADRPLRFGVWLYSHAPHWRPALGKLAEAFPDYFSLSPKMRSVWGPRL
ncbi:MAG TPA: hypothetical protein VJ417_09860, partial [Candidatus Glassbacteria bacterium]|nr:hypothetical protein [Candidatus Glassbacteria bacterium]